MYIDFMQHWRFISRGLLIGRETDRQREREREREREQER